MFKRINFKLNLTPVTFNHASKRSSHIISVHRDTKVDNPNVVFEFSSLNLKLAKEIVARYPDQYKKSAVMPLLDLGQRQHGFTSISVMNYVAKYLDMPPMRVYEVATFYTMYNRRPMGKYFLQVCTTTPCQLCGSDEIMKSIKTHLGIKAGETTPDGLFTLEEVECAGACVNAPVLAINDDYFEDLTPETTVKLLNEVTSGKNPKTGPLSGRKSCEPKSGQKTLLSEAPFDVKTVTRADL